ncbi:MAG TPA: gamma-glutamylcyclotransferase family protein, partial [Pirellulaceae bacterium]|nr:gamma-glutamylcyclotransferase family protein [Pirellulaceae bacterium]
SRLNQFTRVEIAGPEKLEWWRLVDRYLRPMPNVHLYVPVTREDILLRDIAVFDEHDASNALVQLMVPTKMPVVKHLHTRKLERAGYALFAHSQPFAHDVHEVVIDLAQRGKIRQLRTAEDVTEYLGVAPDWNVIQKGEDVQIYFAYGSNLNPTQMSKRVMKHRPVGVAYAKGFELAFSIPGSTWAGAVANIREEEGRFLYGVVYEIDAHGLDRLDFFEGVKQGEYRREMITVYLHDRDAPVQAWVYRGEHRDAIAETPGKIYLDTIVEGAKSHGLPPSYIKQLTGYQT